MHCKRTVFGAGNCGELDVAHLAGDARSSNRRFRQQRTGETLINMRFWSSQLADRPVTALCVAAETVLLNLISKSSISSGIGIYTCLAASFRGPEAVDCRYLRAELWKEILPKAV